MTVAPGELDGSPVIDQPAGSLGSEPSGQIRQLGALPPGPPGTPPCDGRPGASLACGGAQEGRYSTILYRSNDAKLVSTHIASHFKLSSSQCPSTDEDFEYMSRVPYSSAVGSLMYAMVCSRPRFVICNEFGL